MNIFTLKGKTPAQYGQNALYLVTKYPQKEIVNLLIEKEIDINQTDKDGWNALNLSSRWRYLEIVELLIE